MKADGSVVADAEAVSTSVTDESPPAAGPSRQEWQGRAAVVATVIAVVPAIVAIVALVGHDWLPLPDTAVIDARVRDVFGGHLPLVGAYSRNGWNHPGPLLFYVLAPFNALAGGATWGTLAGGAVLEVVAIALAAWLAWRRGGLLLVLIVVAALEWTAVAVGPQLFLDPWNPNPPVLFLAIFILQLWSVALGERWHLVGAAIVGSFIVQSHLGYAPLVAAGVLWCAVVVVLEQRRTRSGREWLRPVAASALVGVFLWLPAVINQLTAQDGNVGSIIRWLERGNPTTGLKIGAQLLAVEFRPLPPWLGGAVHRDPSNPIAGGLGFASVPWLLVPAVLLAAAALVAHRRRARDARLLVALMAVMLVAALVDLSTTAYPIFEYVYQWKALVAALVVGVSCWAGLRSSRLVKERRFLVAASLLLIVAIAVAAARLTNDVVTKTGLNPLQATTQSLIDRVEARGLPNRPFLVRDAGPQIPVLFYDIVNELDRLGAPVRVGRSYLRQFGDHRVATTREVSAIWYVAPDGAAINRLTLRAGAHIVARTTPLSASEERELLRLQHELTRVLRAAGHDDLVPSLQTSGALAALPDIQGIDRADVDRLRALLVEVEHRAGKRLALIAFAPEFDPRA